MALTFAQDFTQANLTDANVEGGVMTFARSGLAYHFNSSGVWSSVADGVPRVATGRYNGSTWDNVGINLEPQGDNLCLRSEEMDNGAWSAASSTVTANAGDAPDGNTTADDILHTDAADVHTQGFTITADADYALSAFVKQGTTGSHDWVRLAWTDVSDGGGIEVYFNVSDGSSGQFNTIGTGTKFFAGSSGIEDCGGGWYRINLVGTISSGQTDAEIVLQNVTADGGTTSDLAASVLWWGIDLKKEENVSSYVPTTSTSVTRNAETLNVTTFATWGSTTAGTVIVDSWVNTGVVTNTSTIKDVTYFSISDNSSSDQIWLESDDGGSQGNDPKVSIYDGSFVGAMTNANLLAVNAQQEHALAWAVDDAGYSIDGNTTVEDNAVATIPGGLTDLDIGARWNNALPFKGYIKHFRYYDERRPNTGTNSLETPEAFPSAAGLSIPIAAYHQMHLRNQ